MKIEEVREAIRFGREANSHINPMFLEARNPEKWAEIRNSPYFRGMLDEVLKEAEGFSGLELEALPYSKFKLFAYTGSRKEYEIVYFQRRKRLCVFALLSLIYDSDIYLKELEDTIWAICDEYTWCLPAHLPGKGLLKSEGDIDQQVKEHRETIDLFSAETAFALAEILSLLEGKIAADVVQRTCKEIRERVIESYCRKDRTFWWETCTMNWAAVCAGSVGVASMYMIKDHDLLAGVLEKVLRTMNCFLDGFGDDGACAEGLGYWNYGFGFYIYFAVLLRQQTGGRIDLMADPKVKQIALFQQKCYLGENHIASFSDSPLTFNFNPGLTHYLKSLFAEVDIPDIRYAAGFNSDHCYRWGQIVRNLVWNCSEYMDKRLKDDSCFMEVAQWLVSRKAYDDGTISFAAKGGHNDEPHNHNDIGSFILYVDGETLLADIGHGEYNSEYFGPGRYSILCNGSQGHSVPIVEGRYQREGSWHSAKIIEVQTGRDRDILAMDIAGAYDVDNLKSLVRNLIFEKEGDVCLVLKDSYSFRESPVSITERFVTFVKPVESEKGKVAISGRRGTVEMLFNHLDLDYSMFKETYCDHHATLSEMYIIDLRSKNPQKNIDITVRFRTKHSGLLKSCYNKK